MHHTPTHTNSDLTISVPSCHPGQSPPGDAAQRVDHWERLCGSAPAGPVSGSDQSFHLLLCFDCCSPSFFLVRPLRSIYKSCNEPSWQSGSDGIRAGSCLQPLRFLCCRHSASTHVCMWQHAVNTCAQAFGDRCHGHAQKMQHKERCSASPCCQSGSPLTPTSCLVSPHGLFAAALDTWEHQWAAERQKQVDCSHSEDDFFLFLFSFYIFIQESLISVLKTSFTEKSEESHINNSNTG